MRGFLLVALGAALIWLGLRRGGTSSAAGPDETNLSGSSALDGAPKRGEGFTAKLPEQGGDRGPSASERGPSSETAVRPVVPPAASDAAGPARAEPAVLLAADESLPLATRTRAIDLALDGARRSVPGTGAELARSEAPEQLARLLVECWGNDEPGPLEQCLSSDDEARLPVGRRQLIASFWQACRGESERARAQLDRIEAEGGVTGEQLALLQVAISPGGSRAIPASSSSRDPLARAMRMVLAESEGRIALTRADYARAAEAYSDLVLHELGAPWPPQRESLLRWGEALHRAQKMHRLSPRGPWASVDYLVKSNDNLIGIRKRVIAANDRLLLCTGLMAAVNQIDGDRITPGDTLRFPTDIPNVLVDLDARVAVFRLGSEAVRVWQVGIGREGHETPVGTYVVGEKMENPPHMPHGGPPLPFGHPENPLGTRWIAWNKAGKGTTFGFHGTSNPNGVGERVSKGCIRMRNEDVEELFELLPRDARIVVQP